MSKDSLKARYDQQVTVGSYSVAALLDRTFTLDTKMGPKSLAAQVKLELVDADHIVLYTDTGALPFKRVTDAQ